MFYRSIIFLNLALVVVATCRADTRFLTGNFFDEVHSGGGQIMDVSTDGKLILFTSAPSAGTSSLPGSGMYLRNLATGSLDFIGNPSVTHTGISEAQVSDDGRYICWATVNDRHIFWMDRTTNAVRWITEFQNARGEQFPIISTYPIMSSDGRYIAFASNSLSLETDSSKWPAATHPAVHLYDTQARTFKIISLSAGQQQISGIGDFARSDVGNYANFDMTPDARYLVFSTDWPSSHPDRENVMFGYLEGVIRRDLVTGASVLLNKDSAGVVSNASFSYPRISSDGNRVAFIGTNVGFDYGRVPQSKMIAGFSSNFGDDLYLKEINTQKVWAITRTNNNSRHSGILGKSYCLNTNGSVIAFSSTEDDLISNSDGGGGSGETADVFRAVPQTTGLTALSLITESPTAIGNVGVRNGPFMPSSADFIAFGTDQFAAMGFPGNSTAFHGVGVGTFPIPVIDNTAFDQWASVLPEGKRGPNDNPSGDGIPNLVKYFIGSDARIPDLRFLPIEAYLPGTEVGRPGDTKKYMTMTIRVRKILPGGYEVKVQAANSLDLLSRFPGPTLPVGQPVADGNFEFRTFRSFSAMGETGFMRMAVSKP